MTSIQLLLRQPLSRLFLVSFFFLLVAVPAYAADGAVKKGDKVTLDYKGYFEDGKMFDQSSDHKEPFSFVVGSGQVIPGLDKALIGMKLGGTKEVKIHPKEAYGEYNPKAVQVVPRDQLPPKPDPKVGMALRYRRPDGQAGLARITKVEAKNVTMDLNHPLAGKILIFKIKVTKIG